MVFRLGFLSSPYLFILVLEILFIQVRNDDSIKVLKVSDLTVKLRAFSDDTTFFVRDKQSLNKIINLMKSFEPFISLTANIEKSEVNWIGSSKHKYQNHLKKFKMVSSVNHSLKMPGVHFSYDKSVAETKNFRSLNNKIRDSIKIWGQSWLTLAGKIHVFKSLIASVPVFVTTMKSIPKGFLNAFPSLYKDFVWNGKRLDIKHSTLIGNYGQ